MNKNFNVGIYGDSYADGRWGRTDALTSWPIQLLADLNCPGKIYGLSGTSTWWSFDKFEKTFHNHDVIVFCYSSPNRWPLLPEELEGWHWKFDETDPNKLPAHVKELADFNKIFFDIFNNNLFKLIDQAIFRSVNETVEKAGKYLINILPFGKIYELPKTRFPVFHNLIDISQNEKVREQGKIFTLPELHIQRSEYVHDLRQCHVNNNNNKLLSKTFEECIRNNTLDVEKNVFKDMPWSEFDDYLEQEYRNKFYIK
jgi:hypothetical protein